MYQRKCHVCEKMLEGNSKDDSMIICAECKYIAYAVSIAVLEINRRSRSMPDQIQISEVIKIMSENNFMQNLCAVDPHAVKIVEELTNPLLKINYLDEEKINRCFDFFEKAEDIRIKEVGSANYRKGRKAHYKIIKSFPNIKEFVAATLRKINKLDSA